MQFSLTAYSDHNDQATSKVKKSPDVEEKIEWLIDWLFDWLVGVYAIQKRTFVSNVPAAWKMLQSANSPFQNRCKEAHLKSQISSQDRVCTETF